MDTQESKNKFDQVIQKFKEAKDMPTQTSIKKKENDTGAATWFSQFGNEKKSEFLRISIEFWPNLSHICAAVGVARSTVYLHRKSDPAFNQALKDIDDMVCDEMEATMRNQGIKPQGFLDRMAYLRAHRPELYDRAKVVKIEGYKMGDGEKEKRMIAIDGAVDAEIVKTYLNRKEQRERRQQLKAGGVEDDRVKESGEEK